MSLKLKSTFFCGCIFSVLMYSDGSPAATLLEQGLPKNGLYSSSEIEVTNIEYETIAKDILKQKENPVLEPSNDSIFTTTTSFAKADSEIKEMRPQNTSENSNTIMNFGQDTFNNTNQEISSEEDAVKTSHQINCRDVDEEELQIKLEAAGGSRLFRKKHATIGKMTISNKKIESSIDSGFLFNDPLSKFEIFSTQNNFNLYRS